MENITQTSRETKINQPMKNGLYGLCLGVIVLMIFQLGSALDSDLLMAIGLVLNLPGLALAIMINNIIIWLHSVGILSDLRAIKDVALYIYFSPASYLFLGLLFKKLKGLKQSLKIIGIVSLILLGLYLFFLEKNTVALRRMLTVPHEMYLLEKDNYKISFIRPEGFRVDGGIGSFGGFQPHVYISIYPPYPDCLGFGGGPWLRIISNLFSEAVYKGSKLDTTYETIYRQLIVDAEKKTVGNNTFYILQQRDQRGYSVGSPRMPVETFIFEREDSTLSLVYQPNVCSSGGKDFTTQLTNILSSLEYDHGATNGSSQ